MFRLNKLTDYGIVLMAHVARSSEDTPHTARSLAQDTRLPLPTVGKLMRQLSEHGLLTSHRGVNGGYNLARPAASISVADIILALEGPIGFTECSVVAGLCEMERSCSIKINSQIIGDALRDALERVTLAELNQQMPQHDRRMKDKIISIEPAMAEGVR
jgi:FeS assembly SUF system regulator